MTDNPENKRKHPRISPLLIRTDFTHGYGERVYKGYLTNLSYGGAFLATTELVPAGTTVQLRVTLPWNVGQVDAEARVVWRRSETASSEETGSPGMGVQFVKLGKDATDKFKMYFQKFTELAARLPSSAS